MEQSYFRLIDGSKLAPFFLLFTLLNHFLDIGMTKSNNFNYKFLHKHFLVTILGSQQFTIHFNWNLNLISCQYCERAYKNACRLRSDWSKDSIYQYPSTIYTNMAAVQSGRIGQFQKIYSISLVLHKQFARKTKLVTYYHQTKPQKQHSLIMLETDPQIGIREALHRERSI